MLIQEQNQRRIEFSHFHFFSKDWKIKRAPYYWKYGSHNIVLWEKNAMDEVFHSIYQKEKEKRVVYRYRFVIR